MDDTGRPGWEKIRKKRVDIKMLTFRGIMGVWIILV